MCVLLEDMRVLEVPEVLYLNQAADDHYFLLVKTGIFFLLQLLFRYIKAGGIPSILFCYMALLFSITIC